MLAQPRLVHGETDIFRSRRQGLEEAVGTMRRSLSMVGNVPEFEGGLQKLEVSTAFSWLPTCATVTQGG